MLLLVILQQYCVYTNRSILSTKGLMVDPDAHTSDVPPQPFLLVVPQPFFNPIFALERLGDSGYTHRLHMEIKEEHVGKM